MEMARGLSLWLGAALLGSVASTAAWHTSLGGQWTGFDLRAFWGIAATTLFWTVPGSALLSIAFAWTGGRGISMPLRRGLILLLGAAAGAAIMVPFGTSEAVIGGVSYGIATALAWVVLHQIMYGRARTPERR